MLIRTDLIADNLDDLNQAANDITSSLTNINSSVDRLSSQVVQGFENIAAHLLEQRQQLEQITATLKSPYHTQSLELRESAFRWLQQGMKSSGVDRDENFKDAKRLFDAVSENPIGNQDPSVWFNIGW